MRSLALLLACTPAPVTAAPPTVRAEVPVIDELAWMEQVRSRRPELLRTDCYNTLTVKPRYREALLASGDSYATMVAREYSPAERAADQAWIKGHQEATVSFCQLHPDEGGCARVCEQSCDACPDGGLPGVSGAGGWSSVRPAGYPLCSFVGFLVNEGTGGAMYDPHGVVQSWKVFFEFGEDYVDTLTPESYLAFSQQLAAAGYRGDSKINAAPSRPGTTRFQYNNIVVHAHTPADAILAEKVGLAHFGGALAGHGRGLDVGSAPSEGAGRGSRNPSAWHHFLCEGDLGVLSEEALDFVGFGTRVFDRPPSAEGVAASGAAGWTALSRYESDRIGVLEILWHPDFVREPALRAAVRAAIEADLASSGGGPAAGSLVGKRVAVSVTSPEIAGVPSRGRGIGTHRSADWLVAHGADAAREGVTEIYNAHDYLDTRVSRPTVLVDALTGFTAPRPRQ